MYKFEIEHLALPNACVIHHPVFEDDRGRFTVVATDFEFAKLGLETRWTQENESLSRHPHTLRGLHAQHSPFAQAKLVRCVAGQILDIIVDARRGSPAYGKSTAITLTAESAHLLYVPAGFLHGFLTLEPNTIVSYKVDAEYSPEHEFAVVWDDPELALEWPQALRQPVLSDKDRDAMSWAEFQEDNTFVFPTSESK